MTKQKQKAELVLDIEAITAIDGTCIPIRGAFDGSFASASQFFWVRLDIMSYPNAVKLLNAQRGEFELTIHCKAHIVKRRRGNKSWNANVIVEEQVS